MVSFEWYTAGTNRGEPIHRVSVLDIEAEVVKGSDGYSYKVNGCGKLGLKTASLAKKAAEAHIATMYEKRKQSFMKDSKEFYLDLFPITTDEIGSITNMYVGKVRVGQVYQLLDSYICVVKIGVDDYLESHHSDKEAAINRAFYEITSNLKNLTTKRFILDTP